MSKDLGLKPEAWVQAVGRPMEVYYDKGFYFPYLDLWMDATRVKDFSIVSHGHSDHTAKHKKALATPGTARILRARHEAQEILELPYGTPWEGGDGYRLTLYPAGHCLGSSQILLEMEDSGERIVYTGDFKLRANPTAEQAPVIPCDVLILDATFGHPRYSFPPDEEVIERLSRMIEWTLNSGITPIVVGYALGKSQEALKLLIQRGFSVTVHREIHRMAMIYQQSGVDFGGEFSLYEGGDLKGQVLMAPPHRLRSPELAGLRQTRSFFLTGWAMDPRAHFRYRVDAALPFSDHADFASLVQYVEEAKPSRIFTAFGFPHLAAYLQTQGYNAQHLGYGQMMMAI